MGGSSSVAQVNHTRETILLALHSQLNDTGEPISTLALAAFRRADRNHSGWIASSSLDAILRDLGLADRWDRLHVDAFAHCFLEHDNECELQGPRTSSRLDYLAFLDIVFFPIQVSRDCVQLKITQPAVVSAGGWRVHDGEYAGRAVAIKEVELCEPGNTNEAVVQLRRRVNALRLAAHPNLLRYVTSVQTKQSLYIVQQAHASCTLKTILQSFGPMKETTIRRYLVQIVDALAFLHSHDIVHGNLHLESIHIDSSGLLKLSDYGASAQYCKLLEFPMDANDWLRQFPPPEHAAPIAAETRSATKAADVWVVGVLVLQMTYGVGNEAEIALQAPISRSTSPQSVGAPRIHPPIPKSMSKDLRRVVQTCLQRLARARPPIDAVGISDFFHVDPAQAKSEMLRNVCTDLDASMDRLRSSRSKPSAFRTTPTRQSAPGMQRTRPVSSHCQR